MVQEKNIGVIQFTTPMKKQQKKEQQNYQPLKQVYGSSYCQFSVVENKVETLYKNQEKIYALLQKIDSQTSDA